MRQYIQYIYGMALASAVLAGCTAVRQAGGEARAIPAAQALTADAVTGEVRVKTVFHLPAGYLSKRNRLVVAPRLLLNDTVAAEYPPLVVDGWVYGKKSDRRKRLKGYEDPYASLAMPLRDAAVSLDLPFEATVALPDGGDRAELVAVLSLEGCESCAAIDTLPVGTLRRRELPLRVLRWMEPDATVRPKVVEGSGEAQLRFLMDKDEIDPALGHNREELRCLSEALARVFKDTLATMNSLTITGMASADGPREHNLLLARDRAEAARDWLADAMGIDEDIRHRIAIDARPEGWGPVLRLMEADGHPEAARVRDILDRWPDSEEDRQERAIRALPRWGEIKGRYLATDRKVAYTYAYTLRSFTSEEELRLAWRSRPDALSEEEWLRLASLMRTDGERREVYEAMTAHFPASEVALNNLAVICLREGRVAEAKAWLCRVPRWCGELEGKRLTLEE